MSRKRRRARWVQRFWLDESGQSSFFAALTLFLLVTAIGYSYNVSLVVSRRVRLQNAADAAALSAAAVEANALSAIAWLNGCETYIHARMQEILLDIPYTATAAATAEWGRYVQDRYGTGDLKKNPVEMNHNTNKVGLLNGLWNQIKDLVKGLGNAFSGLDENGGGFDEEARKNLESLLNEYYASGTTPERKKVIEKELIDKYGLDIRGGNTLEMQQLANDLQGAVDDLEKTTNALRDEVNAFNRNYGGKKYDGSCIANTRLTQMKNIGDAIVAGINANDIQPGKGYEPVNSAIGADRAALRKRREELAVLIAQARNANNQPLVATYEKELAANNACDAALKELRDQGDKLDARVKEMENLTRKIDRLQTEIKNLAPTDGNTIEPDVDAAEKRKNELLKEWEKNNSRSPEKEYSTERSMILNSYNDPPEPWALLKMVPIPAFNPYGPNMNFGRMSPLGTSLEAVGIGGKKYSEEKDVKRDDKLEESIKNWAKEKTLAQGLPPWEELKTSLAGPLGKYTWPDLMRVRYSLDSKVDSMDDFIDFFHNTLIKQAKKWVGYRNQSGSGQEGIRPGEQWIRQLSQISAAIASALPKLVRNEVVYSVAVNASTKTTVAIFPDPEDIAKWGDVAFARTDADAGESFFRYDGWFTPPKRAGFDRNWMPPPPYVNMYTMANSFAPSIRAAVTFNNPAVWTEDGRLYANRFLNESRRQNLRMRTESMAAAGTDKLLTIIDDKLTSINKNAPAIIGKFFDIQKLVHGITGRMEEVIPGLDSPFPSLSYVTLVDENDASGNNVSNRRYFRMDHEKSFYWDEYAGRVGGWPETDGPGSQVRIAVKCWNQNDRMWRQPKTDSVNNNKLLFGVFDGLANWFTMIPVTLPVPYASGQYSFNNGTKNMFSKSQINYNLSPRCQTGYAPGSNVFGLGHPMFIPSHGDPGDAFGAADGHWHYMHYHAHSHSCQVGFPGVGGCTALINCAIVSLADWLIKGAVAIPKDDGPFDRRVGWDSTMHYPYKHWDGTVADDSSAMFGGEEATAARNHIFCAVSTSNKFSKDNYAVWNGISKFLNHGEGRQPPFTIPLTSNISTNIFQLVPPLSLYRAVDNCPKISIFKITICRHLLTHVQNASKKGMNAGLHGHVTCKKDQIPFVPKDMIPLFNTPVLWNWGDMDPSILSMWGAFLTSGDMEGDPLMALGSGDRFFYPEIFYWLNGKIGGWLKIDNSSYSTGRQRLFTKLNGVGDWGAELVGVGGNVAKQLASFDFIKNPTNVKDENASGLQKLLEMVGGVVDGMVSLELGGTNIDVPRLKHNTEMYETGSIPNQLFTTIFDLLSRWGHHRFMTCPLCMSYCPLNCDFHDKLGGYPIRHWGGDYGGADTFDILPARGADFGGFIGGYYKAIGFMSIMPGLLSTGDQKADAGMTYANVLRGHDYSPAKTEKSNKHWYGREGEDTKKDKIPHGNSYFDLGIDLDDGLAGNGPNSALPDGGELTDTDGRVWSNRFPTDRFVREWMSPVRKGGSRPDTTLAPAVVITENFMRHAITVAVVEEYRPMLWMFGGARPMMAVATAKCGFIERPDVYVGRERVVVDGLGVGDKAAPQIITGVGEPDGGAVNARWNLDSLWNNFLDFPNARPIGESNLYYGNWGAKMIPTRFAILTNAVRDTTNARRNIGQQLTDPEAAHRSLWRALGAATCYRGDGVTLADGKTLAARAGMSPSEWNDFADQAVDFARAAREELAW